MSEDKPNNSQPETSPPPFPHNRQRKPERSLDSPSSKTTPVPRLESEPNEDEDTVELTENDQQVLNKVPVVIAGGLIIDVDKLRQHTQQSAITNKEKPYTRKTFSRELAKFIVTPKEDKTFPSLRETLEYVGDKLNIPRNEPKTDAEKTLARSMDTIFQGYSLLDALDSSSLTYHDKHAVGNILLKRIANEYRKRSDNQD